MVCYGWAVGQSQRSGDRALTWLAFDRLRHDIKIFFSTTQMEVLRVVPLIFHFFLACHSSDMLSDMLNIINQLLPLHTGSYMLFTYFFFDYSEFASTE